MIASIRPPAGIVPRTGRMMSAVARQNSPPCLAAKWSSQSVDTMTSGVLTAALACLLVSPVSMVDASVPLTTEPGTNLGFLDNEAIDKKRDSSQMKRSYDGHVAIRNKETGSFWDLKLDMASPGTLLFRSPDDGEVYILGFAAFSQVDLSDDDTVAAISADDWEEKIVPVQSDDSPPEKLEVTREGFFNLLSVIDPELK